MRVYSIVKNGKRKDMSQEEFKRMIETADASLSKGKDKSKDEDGEPR